MTDVERAAVQALINHHKRTCNDVAGYCPEAEAAQKLLAPKLRSNTKAATKARCYGCYNNFYNGHNDLDVKECWSLKTAKKVKKKLVGVNDMPPWKTQPVIVTNSCYRRQGYVTVDPKTER